MERKKKDNPRSTSSLTITIEVTGGTHAVRISDSAGNEKLLDSVLVTGMGDSDLYTFGWGHPYKVANALAEGISRGDEWYAQLLSCIAHEFAKRCVPTEVVDAKELVERWEKEDKERERFAKRRLS